MAEWNLSVRLTGQGSGLARTLRDLSRDARTASRNVDALRRDIARLRTETRNPIRVRLDVDGAHLRRDVTAALASAGSGQGLRVRLDLDAGHLRTDVSAALSAAGSGQGLAVNLRLGNRMQLRREVEDAVRWAAWGHRIEIPIGLQDPMQLRRDVSDAVRWASMSQTISIRVTPDTSALRGLGSTIGGGSGGGANFGLAGLLPIATAAIPLIAGLTSGLAPLAGMLAATGGAATAFGIALAGQIGPLSDVVDAEKEYQDAVRDHGKSSKEAMEAQLAYQRQLAALPPETQKAAIALSNLRQSFGDWSDEMAGFTMEPVTKGFTVLETLLPHLSPEVESFSGSLDRLMNVAGGAIQTPGFDALSDRVAELTDAQLDSFTDQVIHLLRVVSEGDADAGAVGQIMDYMRENGPAAREALDAIGDAVGTLAEGAAQAGPTMLTLVTAAANLVAALPPELVAIILQVAAALKLLQLAGAGAAAVAGGIAAVRTQIATLGAASVAAGGGLAGFRAAFLALGVAAKASVVVAGIGLAAVAIHELSNLGESAPPNVDKLTTSLGKLGQTGKATGYVAEQFGAKFEKLESQIGKVTDPSVVESINNWGADITGGFLDAGEATEEFTKSADSIDESLTNLVRNGNAELAAQALQHMMSSMNPEAAKKLRGELEGYDQALADLKFEAELTAQSQGIFGEAAQQTSAKLDAQKASADGLRQSIVALNDVNRAAGSAMSAFEQSIDDATAAVKEHGGALKLRDGELDLGSEKAREAEKVLSDLAANTDAAATAAREQGRSWEYVSGIQDRGRDAFIKAADAMGLSKEQAEALAATYLKIPDSKSTRIEMRTEDAIAGLDSVIAAIKRTPGSKSVTVSALTSDAIAMLEELGFTVKRLPDGRFQVTADTATAKQRLAGIQAARDGLKNKTITISARDAASAAAVAAKAAIDKVRSKQVTITARYQTIGIQGSAARSNAKMMGYAQGGVVDYYADGGIQRGGVRHFATGSENHVAQIAPAGSWRVWGEPETGGESYIPLSPSKRTRSRAIAEETVLRLGGDPAAIQWNADGGISGWQYDPVSGSLYSPSDAGQAGKKTRKVKGKDVSYYDIAAVERKLWDMGAATVAWNRNLEKVADRAGGDVAKALASMGEDGMKIAAKMATGTNKYVASMSIALRRLNQEARASLKDFTIQLDHATGNNRIFQDNLVKLTAMGFGDLAGQLAAQNDQAAHELAVAAVGDKTRARKANDEVKQAKAQLTPDQMADLIQIIAAITTKTTGIHDVAGKTGLGEDVIIEVANKAKTQISKSLGSRAGQFLADLGKANKGLAYADGGIRAGIYATRGGLVRFAEPETHGEAYVPLSPSKRRTALPVLADVANRFGVGLTDASAGRPVVIVRHGDTTQVTVTPVRTGATATDIAAQVGRSVRRSRRGGVAARAA